MLWTGEGILPSYSGRTLLTQRNCWKKNIILSSSMVLCVWTRSTSATPPSESHSTFVVYVTWLMYNTYFLHLQYKDSTVPLFGSHVVHCIALLLYCNPFCYNTLTVQNDHWWIILVQLNSIDSSYWVTVITNIGGRSTFDSQILNLYITTENPNSSELTRLFWASNQLVVAPHFLTFIYFISLFDWHFCPLLAPLFYYFSPQ